MRKPKATIYTPSIFEPDAMFEEIHRVKLLHRGYAKNYSEGHIEGVIHNIYRLKYRMFVTYRYEPFDIIVDNPAGYKMFLLYMILENALLYHVRGMLKNSVIAVVGAGGTMKTTYSILSCIGALQRLGKDVKTAKEITKNLVFFESLPFVEKVVYLLKNRLWTPFLIVDDIGSQISKYWIHLGEHYWSHLFSILDHIKDWTGTLIVTAKSWDSIPARIKDIVDFVVDARGVVTTKGITAVVMEYYKKDDYRGKHSSRIKNVIYVDVFPPTAKQPDDIWETMMEKRREIGIRRAEQTLAKLMEKVLGEKTQ